MLAQKSHRTNANTTQPIKVLLVDPSTFTSAYDLALDHGLRNSGIRTCWAVRLTRAEEIDAFNGSEVKIKFYAKTENTRLPRPIWKILKGLSHLVGLIQILRHAQRREYDIIHFQWAPIPLLDGIFFVLIKKYCPVILTVHDTTPYNGGRFPILQIVGFNFLLKQASSVITHTKLGHEKLTLRGVLERNINVIKHGPLTVSAKPNADFISEDGRYTIVLFGQLKPYKGLDVLLSSLSLIPASDRLKLRVIIAGAAYMDMRPVVEFIDKNQLKSCVEIIERRLLEEEVARLFEVADCFVFPYWEIDASGVFYLVSSQNKWIIASRIGVFAEEVIDGLSGYTFPVGDYNKLSEIIMDSVGSRPHPAQGIAQNDWRIIGESTRRVYNTAINNF